MPVTPTTCPLDCPDACGVLVESDDRGRFVRLRGNPEHGYSRGTLCGKTSLYGDLIVSPQRLLTPLVRDGKKSAGAPLRPASWEEAARRVAERVRPLPGKAILAAWYAGSLGLVARKFPLRMMHALGATLVDGGLCDNTASAGYEAVLGRPVGFDLERADEADLVVLWGCDMVRTVSHLQPAVQRLCKRGVPVLAIDIYRTETIRALERWGGRGLVVRPGSDAALALALARLAFERGHADRDFLARACMGAEAFEAHVRAGHDVDWAARETGLAAGEIRALAELLGAARTPLLKTGVGFTRRRVGGMSMRAVCSLAAVLGKAEAVHYESFGMFELAEDAVERPDLRPPDAPLEVVRHVELGKLLASERFRALFVWGHNPAVTCPDSALVRRGMERDELFLVVHEHFLTETAARADVVLPATMFPEHADVYRSWGHRRMQLARRACLPPPGPLPNAEAFAALARALELRPECWDVTPESVSEELLAASRARIGVEGMGLLRAGKPVKLEPRPERGRGTPSGKIELESATLAAAGQPAMASYVRDDSAGCEGRFWLTCAPSRHTHNSTFSHSERHLARNGTPRVFVHPDDAAELGIAEGELATLSNRYGRVSLAAALTLDMPRGMLRVDGMPRGCDTPEGVGINALVPPAVSDLGDGNVLYSARVDLTTSGRLRAEAACALATSGGLRPAAASAAPEGGT